MGDGMYPVGKHKRVVKFGHRIAFRTGLSSFTDKGKKIYNI